MTENEEKSPEQLIEGLEQAQHPVTHDDVTESFQNTPEGSGETDSSSKVVPIAAIIASAVVMLGCIFACAAVVVIFLINAPW